ncbi:hypothetical protein ACSQ67_012555 [Phaseolus vulgaris]
MNVLKLKAVPEENPKESVKRETVDLGNGSDIVYIQRLIPSDQSWKWFQYLDKHIPWTRPTIRVFGKSFLQPRDTCYVATPGLTELTYSGYQPHAYSWDDYPPLKDILDAVHKALPGSSFNSLLLNRYNGGNDYVGWHSDDEKLYGPTPEIASLTFGCERDFVLKKKPCKKSCGIISFVVRVVITFAESPVFLPVYVNTIVVDFYVDVHELVIICCGSSDGSDEPACKRLKKGSHDDQHTFRLKHGSLLVMRGYTQRDWIHSVPKRTKAEATRINLTFRRVF